MPEESTNQPSMNIPDEGAGDQGAGQQQAGQDNAGGDEKIAGKFESTEQFDQGFNELAKQLGVDDIVPQQFESQDKKVEYYKRLESKYHQRQSSQSTPPEQAAEGLNISEPGEGITEDLGMNDVLSKAGVDVNEFAQHYNANGKVSEDHVKAIKNVLPGITTKMINEQAQMGVLAAQHQQTQNEQIVQGATQMLGGQEQLQNLLNFGRQLPEAQRKSINERLKDPQLYKGALIELQHEAQARGGAAGGGGLADGTSMPAGSGSGQDLSNKPFADNNEYIAAKRDQRYGRDVQYTKMVQSRLANTPDWALGIPDASNFNPG